MRILTARGGATASDAPVVGYAFGLFAGVCYGAWSIIAKIAISDYDIPPLLFAAVAFFFGTIMFGPVLAYDLPRAIRLSKRAVVMFAISGAGSGGAIVALSFALETGDVTVVAPIVSISPLITLFLVRVFLERLEKVTLRMVLGALLVAGGTVLVVVGNSAF